ncbi:FAD-dependent oxidoreductase [Isoptericola sp. b441]|uniref:FAD-dependent oxidoreductase n=1 Tax=Actinotalea lenta TaxID=3064654 RepID=A0ABT9D4L3_9CELL|nr:FAD-dependent oxidoreductase [Isoptericola sp. b441]MDO8105617.1 FAD-dependent oxidoreductase [Isoptericola sp. b441]
MSEQATAVRSVVVVGAGLAGARTVAALRGGGFEGSITLLGAEGVEPYDRPPLSKELLSRTTPAWLRDELGIDLDGEDARLGEPATGLEIAPHAVAVRTDAGDLSADAVVIATGAAPVRPAGWGTALTLHTAADAAALRARLGPGRRLVVVGAGWIGAEVAGVAAAAGTEVTVVEAGAAPLATAVGPTVGALTVPWYAAAGVRLLTGSTVRAVTPQGAVLADDEELPADAVLAAVGVRPATSWLAGSVPLGPDGSVEVDAAMRVPGTGGRVLAVGDVAARVSPRHGRLPGGHWDGALREPDIAAATLLGAHGTDGPADPAPYVWSDQLGHAIAAYGLPRLGDDEVLRGDPAGAFTAVWFVPATDQVRAVLAVDRPRDVAAARRLFSGPRLPHLDRTAAADPDRPLRAR